MIPYLGMIEMTKHKDVPKATLQRYPIYLKALRKLRHVGPERIMSKELAEYVNIEPTTIRRDFSFLGKLGKQGYGYEVTKLIEIFEEELGMGFNEQIILVGCGNLGKALLHYNNWNHVVGEIVCVFDKYPETVKGVELPVYGMDQLKEKIPQGCRIAILCVSHQAQETVDELIENGIRGIVDFTGKHFTVPNGVFVKSIDVVSSIQELVFETNAMER